MGSEIEMQWRDQKFLKLRGVMGSEISENRELVKGSDTTIKESDKIRILWK